LHRLSLPDRTAIGLILALVVLALINIMASRNAARLIAEADQVAGAYEVIIDLRGLLSRTVDAETGGRGYVITGDQRYLAPYNAAQAEVDDDLAALRANMGRPDQRAGLDALEPLVERRFALIASLIEHRRTDGFDAAADLVRSNLGLNLQNDIRARVADLERAELGLLSQQLAAARRSASVTTNLILFSSLLAFAAAVAAVIATRRQSLIVGEDRFRRALAEAPLPVFIHAQGWKVLFANRAFGEATGNDPASFRSLEPWFARMPDAEEIKARLGQVYAGLIRSDTMERQMVLDDGLERTWLVSSAGLGPGADGARQAITLIVDLTERKRVEADLAISNQRLRDLSLRLVEVQEIERRTIARELHDEIGQALTGLDLVLEMAARAPEDGLREHLRTGQGYVRDLTARVRNLSLDLRPSMLDDLGLIPALRWLFQRYSEQTRIAVDFRSHEADRRFPPAVETAAYRVVQEALTNVARHAQVPAVTVQLWGEAERLLVQIEDAGQGFAVEPTFAARRSTGLEGMRERAELIGGTLTVESAPGQGTIIIADLPLDLATAAPGRDPHPAEERRP